MAHALFYQPSHKWRICAAFGASILIHIAAIAASETRTAPQSPTAVSAPDVIGLDASEPVPIEQEQIDIPLPPAPPDIEESIVPEEHITPPPLQRRASRPVKPVASNPNGQLAGQSSMSGAKVLAINAPRPEYPYEARRQHATGSGVAVLHVDLASGNVTSVALEQSTGHAILDAATVSAFRRWRFKPGTVSLVRT